MKHLVVDGFQIPECGSDNAGLLDGEAVGEIGYYHFFHGFFHAGEELIKFGVHLSASLYLLLLIILDTGDT